MPGRIGLQSFSVKGLGNSCVGHLFVYAHVKDPAHYGDFFAGAMDETDPISRQTLSFTYLECS